MTSESQIGTIPQSAALAEAQVDSLAELCSRDPEGYQQQDLDRIIAELRAQRERLAKAQAASPQKAPKASNLLTKTAAKATDLGL
jgi:hypothetical protein